MRTLLIPSLLITLVPTAAAQWSTPVPVANVNTAASDFDPCPSFDGLTLYFTNQTGGWILQRATRPNLFSPFGAPTPITELDSSGTEAGPCVRIDELEIFFYSTRAGGTGSIDIWRATRASKTALWGTPVPVSELNTSGAEGGMSLTADGLTIYYGSNSDIWTATRPNWSSPFANPQPVTELNTSGFDREPHISPDRLTIFYTRTGATGSNDTFMATRLSPTAPFSNIVEVFALNSTAADTSPAFAIYADEIFFTSTRTGGPGSYDIHTARFTGLVANGIASQSSVMSLRFSDPGSPMKPFIAAAALGDKPGIKFDTRTFPLNPDALLLLTVGGYPGVLNGYVGMLDVNGQAAGNINFTSLPGFQGFKFFNAFLVLDPNAPSGIATMSNALEVMVN